MTPKNFTITKVSPQKSRYTQQTIFAVFFKGDDGKSYKSWIDPRNGNYKKWAGLLTAGTLVTGLVVKSGNLIDADSSPKIVKTHEPEVVDDWPPQEQMWECLYCGEPTPAGENYCSEEHAEGRLMS